MGTSRPRGFSGSCRGWMGAAGAGSRRDGKGAAALGKFFSGVRAAETLSEHRGAGGQGGGRGARERPGEADAGSGLRAWCRGAARVQLWAEPAPGPGRSQAGEGLAAEARPFGCCVSTVTIIRRILCLFRLRAVR